MNRFPGRGPTMGALLAVMLGPASAAQTPPDPLAAVDERIAAAEQRLREGELQIAESDYRSALSAGWMVIGALRLDERRLPEAREAFTQASTSAVDADSAQRYLAVV